MCRGKTEAVAAARSQNETTSPEMMRRMACWAVLGLLLAAFGSMILSVIVAAPAGAAGTGSVSGHVTDSLTGSPLAGVCVTARVPLLAGSMTPSSTPKACTDSAGAYTLGGLDPNAYTLVFQDTVGRHVTVARTSVRVPDGQSVQGYDVAMVSGGAIGGTVTDADSGQPLEGVCATVSSVGGTYVTGEGCTGADGTYQTEGLPTGRYTVSFRDTVGAHLPIAPSGSAPGSQTAPVVVTVGATTGGVDAAMTVGGTLSGRVTDRSTGLPIQGVCVATSVWGGADTDRCTDADGRYRTAGLAPGTHNLVISDPFGRYADGYYDGPDAGDEIDNIAIVGTGDTSGFDLTLDEGGSISGTVKDRTTGLPIPGVCVSVWGPTYRAACTAPDGTYSVGGLQDGTYEARFVDNLAFEYLDHTYQGIDGSGWGTQTPIPVVGGNDVSGIDATMARGSRITGVVTRESDGSPVVGACPSITGASVEFAGHAQCSDSSGTYSMWGLVQGTYQLLIDPPDGSGLVGEFYNGADNSTAATPIELAVLGSVTSGIDASLRNGGSISGTVTAEGTGAPVGGVCVTASAAGTLSFGTVGGYGSACTDASGTYQISGLSTGDFTVWFQPAFGANLLAEYFDGKDAGSSADLVSVVVGQPRVDINASLRVGATISGRVTGADTGLGLENACVMVANGGSLSFGSGTPFTGYVCTDAAGDYRVVAMPTGTYTVRFYPPQDSNYLEQSYNGKGPGQTPDPISVTAGEDRSEISAALQPGGSISGRVTRAADGEPVADLCVSAVGQGDLSFGSGGWGVGCTDAEGNYRIIRLGTGQFQVSFPASTTKNLAPQYYSGKTSAATADPVSVTVGVETTGIDAAMADGGSITGIITAAETGQPVANGCVSAVPEGELSFTTGAGGFACSDATGAYRIGGLTTNSYVVSFSPPLGSELLGESYNGRGPGEQPDPVAVTIGAESSGIDASLDRGGIISGTVTGSDGGVPLSGVTVSAVGSGPSPYAVTNSLGQYSLVGLHTGDYRITFSPSYLSNHLSEWYNDKPDMASADLVAVAAGATVTGIDAELVAGGRITGRVTDAETGNPLRGVCAEVRPASSTSSTIGRGCSGIDGRYEVKLLATGNYVVRFAGDADHVSRWYNGKATASSADIVSVATSVTTANVDAALPRVAKLAGTVTDEATGQPLAGVCVRIYTGLFDLHSDCTGADGKYLIGGLDAGSVEVYVSPPSGSMYLEKRVSAVSLALGTTTNLDATLATGGVITGTITRDGGGVGLGCAYAYVGVALAGHGCTSFDDVYRIVVPAGTYQVMFTASGHVGEWYDNVANQSSAQSIVVTAGQTRDHIDASLAGGGTISGTITDAATGLPIEGACAQAGGSFGCANELGEYSIAVPPGTYAVRFDVPAGSYSQRWWQDAGSAADADPVVVAAGAAVTGIDAHLSKGGAIGGLLTDASNGAALQAICVTVFDGSDNQVPNRSACSGADGRYRIDGLAPGSYRIQFTNYLGRYIAEWFDNKASLAMADPVVVSAGETATGDATLVLGGAIAGTVRDAGTGEPLAGICTGIYRADTGQFVSSGGCTGSDGRYNSGGIPAGLYKVEFSSPAGTYVGQWFDHADGIATASPVSVSVGATVDGVNADLTRVGNGISGTIRDGTGQALQGVCAYLFLPDGTYAGAGGCSDEQGRYALSGLTPGAYKVGFYDPSGLHVTRWFDDQQTAASAAVVVVGSTGITTDVDAVMPSVTAVSGTVRNEAGQPIEGVCAYLFNTDGTYAGAGSCSVADGRYVVSGIAAGSYRVAFYDPAGMHVTRWYDAAPDHASAADVVVAADAVTSGIDIEMQSITAVAGHVRDKDGEPVEGVCAYLYNLEGAYSGSGSCSVADGRYVVSGVAPGTYKVGFYDPLGRYVTRWYDGQAEFGSGTEVIVVDRAATDGIDVSLVGVGRIHGRVIDTSGAARTNVCVYADRADGTYSGIGGCTDAEGNYQLGDLPPGSYRLGFYLPETPTPTDHWYHGKADEASAELVEVNDGAVTQLVDEAF